MRDFEELRCWRQAHELTLKLYRATEGFPVAERFGLVSQIRRAAVSIGSNVAEGSGRATQADFARFVDIATGSTTEIKYQLRIAHDLGYVPAASYVPLRQDVIQLAKTLYRFSERLKRD